MLLRGEAAQCGLAVGRLGLSIVERGQHGGDGPGIAENLRNGRGQRMILQLGIGRAPTGGCLYVAQAL